MDKEEIKFSHKSYRLHNDENKRLINKSLKECGTGRSIVIDKDNVIISGNGVYEQAIALGFEVRIIESVGTELIAIKRTDLSSEDSRRKALALADNYTSDTSVFDFSAIVEDFSLDEMKDWNLDIPFDDIPTDIDSFFVDADKTDYKPKTITCPHCGKEIVL